MKASKFTEAQIAFVLKQAETGTPIADVCRKAGISDADVAPKFYPVLSSFPALDLPW
jgi:hypothetical protein